MSAPRTAPTASCTRFKHPKLGPAYHSAVHNIVPESERCNAEFTLSEHCSGCCNDGPCPCGTLIEGPCTDACTHGPWSPRLLAR